DGARSNPALSPARESDRSARSRACERLQRDRHAEKTCALRRMRATQRGSFPPSRAARYAARNASTIFMRAARAAGRKPPAKPIASAKAIDATTIDGVSVNENASSANVWKFVVEIDNACMNDAATRPATPPNKPSSNDSPRNATRIAFREKPSARSVPISATLEATLAYIVIIAPMMAPIEKITEIDVPR